jgi:hypothetical protein
MEPRIHRFRGGWAASGGGFATFAATKEEALRQFRLHAPEAPGCAEDDEDAGALLDGVDLGLGSAGGNTPREVRHVDIVRGPEETKKTRS